VAGGGAAAAAYTYISAHTHIMHIVRPQQRPSSSARLVVPPLRPPRWVGVLVMLFCASAPITGVTAKGGRGKVSKERHAIALNNRELSACDRVRFLLGSVGCVEFMSEYWEKKPLLARNSAVSQAGTLFGSASLPLLLRKWTMKINDEHGQVIFIRPNSFVHDERFAQGGPVTVGQVSEAMRLGDTLLIHNMEIYWKPIGVLSESLSDFTNLYVQVNLYYSPPGAPVAVSLHQDAQSVFIVQVEGRKTWELYAAKQALALKPQLRGKAGDIVRKEEVGEHLLTMELSPGDVLFIPRGVFHATSTAKNGDTSSLHLTVGMETDSDDLTWGNLLAEVIGGASREMPMWDADAVLREALPVHLLRQEQQTPQISKQLKGHATRLIQKMLKGLDDVDDSVWHTALRAGITKRKEHLAAKRKQLLRFRDVT
jgi:ribosomal protein L16 Arg81 hydroxylase